MTANDSQSDATHAPKPAPALHMLSFDVEEYFQVEAAREGGVGEEHWDDWPRRLAPCVHRILAMLEEHGSRATFFVLGSIAAEQPGVVRAIAAAGHEIASHGQSHTMLDRLGRDGLRRELRDSKALLEDLSGREVIGFRAPTFSVGPDTLWALDELAAAGYRYDSSIFPVRHDRYGMPDSPRWAHRRDLAAGRSIVEIPPLTLRLLGMNLPAGGGGYLRILPTWLIAAALRRCARRRRATMLYLHPWELDPDQPVLPMSLASRWRHRVNLSRTAGKLQRLLRAMPFRPAGDFTADPAASIFTNAR